MPIKQTTPDAEIDAYIKVMLERQRKALIYNLQYVGEQCLTAARETDTYKDRTGNLRSSLGYVIIEDGNIVNLSGFGVVLQGNEGANDGKSYVQDIASRFPQGLVLVMVAGMNYASYVQAKGYDVLESSELLAENLVPKMLKKLGFKK